MTIREFIGHSFPTDEACLEHLFDSPVWSRPCLPEVQPQVQLVSYSRPSAPTPANGADIICIRQPERRLRTAGRRCRLWFYAIYLFTTSRHGVPAKELERQLGVTYKTAWRMADLIRKHMAEVDDEWPLFGDVEIDETYVGGRTHGVRGRGAANKTIVFGMMQRKGQVMTKVVPNVAQENLAADY